MARLARVVVPGVAHHVTQRGNRRQETFFREEDYAAYLALLTEWCGRCGVQVWAYCLMPNHVHLIVVPDSEEGLRRSLGEAHRRYTRRGRLGPANMKGRTSSPLYNSGNRERTASAVEIRAPTEVGADGGS